MYGRKSQSPYELARGTTIYSIGRKARVLLLIVYSILGTSNLPAQNVSVSDYQVPVSSAERLSIDLSGNHATTGGDTTTSKGNVGGVYTRFYDSLPFGYFIDAIGSGSAEKDIVKDEYRTDYNIDGAIRVKKYIKPDSAGVMKDIFGSVRLHSNLVKGFDQPASDATAGIGYGRFIDATALAKAVRIEDFLLREGEIKGRLSKEALLELSGIIARRGEYEDEYGEVFKKNWYADMEAVMREAGMLTGASLGAIGVLRIDEVIERERVADRFYGWDATLGAKVDITLPSDDQERPPVNLDMSLNYARPISWKWQLNERLSANTPIDEPFKSFGASLSSDISYELSNRVDFRLRHLIRVDRLENVDAEYSNSLGLSLIYYIENYINLVATEQIEKTPGAKTAANFTLAINYRIL